MQKLTIYNFEEVLKPHLSQLGEKGLSLFESLQSFVAKFGYIKNAEFEASLASFESWLILNTNHLINQLVTTTEQEPTEHGNNLINQPLTSNSNQQSTIENQKSIDYSLYDIEGLRVGEKLEIVKYLHTKYGYPLDKERVFNIGIREIARRAKRDKRTKYSYSTIYNLIRNVLNVDSQLID